MSKQGGCSCFIVYVGVYVYVDHVHAHIYECICAHRHIYLDICAYKAIAFLFVRFFFLVMLIKIPKVTSRKADTRLQERLVIFNFLFGFFFLILSYQWSVNIITSFTNNIFFSCSWTTIMRWLWCHFLSTIFISFLHFFVLIWVHC